MAKITVVGLGPGDAGLITNQSFDVLINSKPLYLRTKKHPSVEELIRKGVEFETYDAYYNSGQTFEEVYSAIVDDIIIKAHKYQHVVYAVPGSPMVAESTVTYLIDRCKKENITLDIKPGMSFLEIIFTKLGIDPIMGLTVLDSADVNTLPLKLTTGLVITQVYNRQIASDLKLALMDRLPDDYEVILVRNLSLPDEEILSLPLFEIDHHVGINHLTSLYVPPMQNNLASEPFCLDKLVDIMRELRAPEGCLWDIEQTHTSLRRYIVEEVYEVLEAIDNQDEEGLREELGDLLLQIVFHAQIADEAGLFNMQAVIDEVSEKLIRRHPHVFSSITVEDSGQVVLNWDKIKKQEKKHLRKFVLDGISPGLPSLMKAYKMQSKAAKVGFDWETLEPVWAKVQEELLELKEAVSQGEVKNIEEEIGDILFTLVNLCRKLGFEPETALNKTNSKFKDRFCYVETKVLENGGNWKSFNLEKLDKWWEEAKKCKEDKEIYRSKQE